MLFRLLGPLRVWDGESWSMIRAAQQRTVLAILLIEAGQVVSIDRLVDEIWGAHPPRTASNTVQGYVMRLRRVLGGRSDSRLFTRGRGYELTVEDGDLDSAVFDRLVESGKTQLARGRPREGAAQLAEALALWRGPALADVPAGLSRSLLADTRTLVVLDNAGRPEQVRPLLPGSPGLRGPGHQPRPAARPGRAGRRRPDDR